MISVSAATVPVPTAALVAQESTGATGSPGVLGFVVTFAVALVVVGLVLAMTSSLRRVRHRAEAAEQPHVPERRAVVHDADADADAPAGGAAPEEPTDRTGE